MSINKQYSSTTIIVIMLMIILVAVAAGIYLNKTTSILPSAQLSYQAATVLDQPKVLHEFKMDSATQKYTRQNLVGHWSLVFFGFTHCPDICPTTLAELNKVYNMIAAKNNTVVPQVLFVSVDPEHDTLQQIDKYAHSFNPHFIGLQASEEQLIRLARELGIFYEKVPGEVPAKYIKHSGVIILMNPKGEVAAYFNFPHQAESMVNDFIKISGHYS